MKTNKFLLAFILFALIFNVSCDEDQETFKTADGTLLSFETSSFELAIPEEDLTLEVPVRVSNTSTSARTYNVAVTDATEGSSGEYTVGSITIPAGEYSGLFTIDFDFSEIGGEVGELREVVLAIQAPDGVSSYNDVLNIKYFRNIVCNDLELTIISDVWATETGFRLERADGTVIVDDFFPFSFNAIQPQEYNVEFFLEDGDYIFTLLDTYGDGQQGSGGGVTLTGSYSLVCDIITHASGEGELDNGTFESTPFSVNP